MDVDRTETYAQSARLAITIFYDALCFISGVVIIIAFCRFKKMMVLTIVQRRYPRIVLLECAISPLTLFVGLPVSMFNISRLEPFISYERVWHMVAFSCYPLVHLIVFCEACRLWLVAYDLHYLYWTQDNAWKLQINSKLGEKNWWLTHRTTLGNSRYVTLRILAFGLASGIISSALFAMFGRLVWVRLLDAMLYGLPLSFVLGTYYKCPKRANDRFLFLAEFQYTAVIYAVLFCSYGIATVTVLFVDWFVGEILMQFIALFAVVFVSLLSALWIPKKILSQMEWQAVYQNMDNNPADLDDQNGRNAGKLYELFGDANRFSLFANHLNQEFASENLLAFVELMQFKQHFNHAYFGVDTQTAIELGRYHIWFDFGQEPLKSEIVYDTVKVGELADGNVDKSQLMGSFKKIAYLLYMRYIRVGSELEVNIASRLRTRFDVWMSNEMKWLHEPEIPADQLLCVFDTVCIELYGLMNHTFYRFVRSEEKANVLRTMSTMSMSTDKQLSNRLHEVASRW